MTRRFSWFKTTCSCETRLFNGTMYTLTYKTTFTCGKWPDPFKGEKGRWVAATNPITRKGKPVYHLPSLKTNPSTLTMAGYSAGAMKSAYIFNMAPSKLRGVGIIGG